MEIRLVKTNIRKQVGGSLLTSIMSFAPTLAKTVGSSALAGLASEGAPQIVKKISGKGVQTGGFIVPNSKIQQLIAHENLLSEKQKRDIVNALQTGSGVSGGFIGALLASIGIPLAIEAFKKVTGAGGVPRIGKPQDGGAAPRLGMYGSPPFFGTWGEGVGEKKTGEGLLLGKNSPLNGIPLLGDIL